MKIDEGANGKHVVKVTDIANTKAELNRRSQACEVLTGTGISRRGKWPEVGGRKSEVREWSPRYAFMLTSDLRPLTSETGIPCWNRTSL